jgi:hypothetical protein
MKDDFIDSIIQQTQILLMNVDETLGSLDENEIHQKELCDWLIGEQIYHMLHSLDQWFISPYDYEEPAIAYLGDNKDRKLTKAELCEYFEMIKGKVMRYLDKLEMKDLEDRPIGCKFNRLELISGQYRHLMYHIGHIHGCLRSQTGHNPGYIGLSLPVNPKNREGQGNS